MINMEKGQKIGKGAEIGTLQESIQDQLEHIEVQPNEALRQAIFDSRERRKVEHPDDQSLLELTSK